MTQLTGVWGKQQVQKNSPELDTSWLSTPLSSDRDATPWAWKGGQNRI